MKSWLSLRDDVLTNLHGSIPLDSEPRHTLCSQAEMAALEPFLTRTIAPADAAGDGGIRGHNRHLDTPQLRELALRSSLCDRVASILGPDLLLWRLHFWCKESGGREIPWHQDWNYWPLEPSIVVSAWIAVDRTTKENACVQLIPGSHRTMLPHIPAPPTMDFRQMADTTGVALETRVDMELDPGQFFLFNERTLHHSDINRSSMRRMGFALRIIPPIVRIMTYDSPDHGVMLMRGSDCLGFNRVATVR